MNLDAAVETYLAESRELLDVMEQALLSLEHDVSDVDNINAVFRAAHTIKGSGGIFGFDIIVQFTHQVESVLDQVRAGTLVPDSGLIALLLECCDHIRSLLSPVIAGEALADDIIQTGQVLQAGLNQYLTVQEGLSNASHIPEKTDTENSEQKVDEPQAETDNWHISIRFNRDVLRNGMDPLSFFRYLGQFGEITHLIPLLDSAPALIDVDPELCYAGFELSFRTGATKADIESAFEFVKDDCVLHLLPPASRLSEYIQLIMDLPEDNMRLGEILVKSGALTAAELELGLRLQASHSTSGSDQKNLETPPLGEILIQAGAVDRNVVAAALDKQHQIREGKSQEKHFIRIDSERLQLLINLVGELVIAGANTHLMAKKAGIADVMESAANLSRLIEEVRNIALGLQMVQIGNTFQRFQRVVHDVSKELGKEIELTITGGDTELDKSVIEQIGDPLMHLVRNAMDHGIEPVEERLALGKPRQGTVSLNAYHDSGSIVLEVADDGYGLDRDKLLAKAIARGIRQPNQSLSDEEIYELIFEPGFSTAEKVSNLSGRGVGMDVVRRNVEALRGNVQIESERGQGTLVRIRLPLTLAIIDGFLVRVGEDRYVIPMDMLVECLEHDSGSRAKATHQGYLDVRGEVLPVIRLADLFGLQHIQRERRENIAVVRYGNQRAGLIVDELLGEFQTVIKPLGDLFSRLTTISGSTILGSGEVALIIDVPGLIHHILTQNHLRKSLEKHEA